MKTRLINSTKKATVNILMILFSLALLTACSKENNDPATAAKSPVVLVHGAWQGDYVWNETKASLEADGYQVTVVKLRGHGTDNTPAKEITFQTYVDQVKNAVNSYSVPVILVGHSLGGGIITQAASDIPQKISKLVYVAGFIPASGKTVLDYSLADPGTLLPAQLEFNADSTEAGVKDLAINLPKIFCQDGTDAQKRFLIERYKAEPTPPLQVPLTYTPANYQAAGKKYYIYTTADNAISYKYQQQMATAAGITDVYRIDSGHSPFVSKPAEFTALMKEIFKK